MRSKLFPDSIWSMCRICIERGFEPRWAVLLYIKRYGINHSSRYIIDKKYSGDPISVRELII